MERSARALSAGWSGDPARRGDHFPDLAAAALPGPFRCGEPADARRTHRVGYGGTPEALLQGRRISPSRRRCRWGSRRSPPALARHCRCTPQHPLHRIRRQLTIAICAPTVTWSSGKRDRSARRGLVSGGDAALDGEPPRDFHPAARMGYGFACTRRTRSAMNWRKARSSRCGCARARCVLPSSTDHRRAR